MSLYAKTPTKKCTLTTKTPTKKCILSCQIPNRNAYTNSCVKDILQPNLVFLGPVLAGDKKYLGMWFATGGRTRYPRADGHS